MDYATPQEVAKAINDIIEYVEKTPTKRESQSWDT